MAEQKFHSIEELQKLVNGWDKSPELKAYLDPEGAEASEVPYEETLREMMADPNAIQELLKTGNKAFIKKYAKSILRDRNIFDLYEMNMDNITESIKEVSGDDDFKKEDILNQGKPYLNVNGSTLKAIAKVNGWDFPSMLKLIEEEQNKQARKKIYDETNPLTKAMFSRITTSMRDKGDFDWQDATLDIGENILQAVPLAGTGAKIATTGARAGLLNGIRGNLVANATTPFVMAVADEVRSDDYDPSKGNLDLGNIAERTATGYMINAAAAKMIERGLGAVINHPKASEWIRNLLDTGDEALRNKLFKINEILTNRRKYSEDVVKNAENELSLLQKQTWFTNPNAEKPWFQISDPNIADYAAKNMVAGNVGKQARRTYEQELSDNINKAWAKAVKKNEAKYGEPYLKNRETLFPHMFVNQKKVGSQAGLFRTTGSHTPDLNEFRIYAKDNLEHQNRVSEALDRMFEQHKSKKFHYGIDFDGLVDKILADPEMVRAIMRAYGGNSPREALISWISNKLGRSEWLDRTKATAGRTFGEFAGFKPKEKKNEEKKSDEEE